MDFLKSMILPILMTALIVIAFVGPVQAYQKGADFPDTSALTLVADMSFERWTAERLSLPQVDVSEDSPLVADVLTAIFMIIGALATLFIIIGGFRYIVSGANPEQVERAKKTIIYSVIGLAVAVFASMIINFVVSSL